MLGIAEVDREDADRRARKFEADVPNDDSDAVLCFQHLRCPLLGEMLAVVMAHSALCKCIVTRDHTRVSVPRFRGLPGRVQSVDTRGAGATLALINPHSPDALGKKDVLACMLQIAIIVEGIRFPAPWPHLTATAC